MKKRDDANQMARRIMSKDCNRGQSAMLRRVGGAVEIDMPLFRQGAAPCEHALVFKIEE